uniref:Uncharacterized protein n=1 Tax=Babesia bovis TaxID=5865 RepID=S6B7N5_BABBO|nr:hypothetical protein [Babesia bovis]
MIFCRIFIFCYIFRLSHLVLRPSHTFSLFFTRCRYYGAFIVYYDKLVILCVYGFISGEISGHRMYLLKVSLFLE